MRLSSRLETLFLDLLEKDICPENELMFSTALEILEKEDSNLIDTELENSKDLRILFGFEEQAIENVLVLEATDSSDSDLSQDTKNIDDTDNSSSEEEQFSTFRMNNAKTEENVGDASTSKPPDRQPTKRKKPTGDFYPPTTEFKLTNNQFGSNVLNLDCEAMKDRKVRMIHG